MKTNGIHIVELRAENVKRLKAVRLKPDGKSMVIGGNNGAGKSAVLDSIVMAFGGAGTIPPEPVRRGEKRAKIEHKLDNGMTVRRTFTATGGTELEITDADGLRLSSPQKILSELFGDLAFDPMAFDRMGEREKVEVLKKLVGADFVSLDRKRQALYDRRTEAGRDLRSLTARRAAITIDPGAPTETVDTAALGEELAKRLHGNSRRSELVRQLDSLRQAASETARRLDELGEKMAALKKQGEQLKRDIEATPTSDTVEIQRQLTDASKINDRSTANRRAKLEAERLDLEIAAAQRLVDQASADIEAIDEAKKKHIADAQIPVLGLDFDETSTRLGGVPWEQASHAERLRAAVGIGVALNPGLRVIVVHDGSLLDEHSLTSLIDVAEQQNVQLFIERAGVDGHCSVIISDGEVLG